MANIRVTQKGQGVSSWFRVLLMVLTLALLAAACGSDDGEAGGTDGTDSTAGEGSTEAAADGSGGSNEDVLIGLITKTETNPFFVKMKEGAQQAAQEAGAEVQSFAGEFDGDNESQVQAI